MNAPYVSVAFFSLVPREGCEAERTFTNILDIPDIALVENAFLTCLKCPILLLFSLVLTHRDDRTSLY